jgi:hypothetical protein
MRVGYSASKLVTFCGLALTQAFAGFPPETTVARSVPALLESFRILAWVAVVFCVFRGLPVIIHWMKHYWGTPAPSQPEES